PATPGPRPPDRAAPPGTPAAAPGRRRPAAPRRTAGRTAPRSRWLCPAARRPGRWSPRRRRRGWRRAGRGSGQDSERQCGPRPEFPRSPCPPRGASEPEPQAGAGLDAADVDAAVTVADPGDQNAPATERVLEVGLAGGVEAGE